MTIEITNEPIPIDFNAEGFDEIAQNVRMILSTRKGSLPLDRDFGIDWSIIDAPVPHALARLKLDIVKQIEKYEPRVRVEKINVFLDEKLVDGQALVKLILQIR
jgi:hypothetical protein